MPLKPTASELEILAVLWKIGPATVKQVHETLGKQTRYTTVLKLMQLMAEKGLVKRDESTRAHLYEAAVKEESMQKRIATDLLEKVFGGSTRKLLVAALSGRKTSKTELEEIRKMIDQMKGSSND